MIFSLFISRNFFIISRVTSLKLFLLTIPDSFASGRNSRSLFDDYFPLPTNYTMSHHRDLLLPQRTRSKNSGLWHIVESKKKQRGSLYRSRSAPILERRSRDGVKREVDRYIIIIIIIIILYTAVGGCAMTLLYAGVCFPSFSDYASL